MLRHITDAKETRDVLIALLGASSALAGISMALVGMINLRTDPTFADTLADDMCLLSGLGFVVVCYFAFFAIRPAGAGALNAWAKVIDIVFLASLTLLVAAGVLLVYELA